MILWKTEFFALSVITGEIETFDGAYIKADTITDAMVTMRAMGLDYLQLTGEWFKDSESVDMNNEFYKKLISPDTIIKDMSFDEFTDWLDLALEKEDLIAAREEFEKVEGLEDYVTIINIYIKKYDKKDKGEES